MPEENRLTVSFAMDNAAFEDPDEPGRLLRDIADKIDAGQNTGIVRDSNGNTVGEWSISGPCV